MAICPKCGKTKLRKRRCPHCGLLPFMDPKANLIQVHGWNIGPEYPALLKLHFWSSLVLDGDVCAQANHPIKWAVGKTRTELLTFFKSKKWLLKPY